jgi:uncharacterized protein YjeT (DUF2065 family)
MTDTLILALGLVFMIEGLAPVLFPNKWKSYLFKLSEQSAAEIRNIGLFLVIIGGIIVWLSQ